MPSRDDEPSPDQPRHRRHSSRSESRRHRAAEKVPEVRATDRGGVSLALPGFNTPLKRIRIHPLETTLLWVVAAHLVFLPWALGTMHLWAQLVSLTLSLASFAIALVPREYTEDESTTGSFRMIPVRRLWRFPIFWLGLALLALITIQGLNPAWAYQTNGKSWWMVAIPHLTWLPSGVRGPFVAQPGLPQGTEWRNLIIYTSGLLTVCAIWLGFTRRRTIQRFFTILAANGVALAAFGAAERLFGNDKIYWLIPSDNAFFFASFIYKNHAGAFLNLMLAITCGLAAWYHVRGQRRLEKSNPSGVFVFLAMMIAVAVFISFARGATLVMIAYLCVVGVGFAVFQWRQPSASRRPVITVALLLVFAFFLKTGLDTVQWGQAWSRLQNVIRDQSLSVRAREVADHASLDMLRAHWGLGTGSGSFAFLFPIYQQHYPDIAVRQFWEHAHNDILEFPIELGVPGMLLFAGCFGCWGYLLIRSRVWENAMSATIVLGCLFLVGMSWGDFIFQNPAILITWCSLWPACALWTQLEERRGGG